MLEVHAVGQQRGHSNITLLQYLQDKLQINSGIAVQHIKILFVSIAIPLPSLLHELPQIFHRACPKEVKATPCK